MYKSVVPQFEEIKRKIDVGEEPYVDRRYGEEPDEPAFLDEYQDADLAADVIGMTCLSMLQATFQSFLREYVKEVGGGDLLGRVRSMKQGSWFADYRAFFESVLGIDWAASGVDIGFLEHIILTRNDYQHNMEIFSGYVYQTEHHANKYPKGAFRDARWPVSIFMPARLIVQPEKLEASIEAVDKLCEFLEDTRRKLRRSVLHQ